MTTTTDTYTNRHIEIVRVAKVHEGGHVTWSNGWSFGGIPEEHRAALTEGTWVVVETTRLTLVTGVALWLPEDGSNGTIVDTWLWRKTDADLEQEHADMLANIQREQDQRWAEKRDDWHRREAQLPHPLRRRLMRFRDNGGHDFETGGWGYELVVCELAVLYATSGQTDDDTIAEYAQREGTSGNQHDYAKQLSKLLTDDLNDQDKVANSVAALAPISGDADYSGSRS